MKKRVVVNPLKKSCIRLKLTKGSNKDFEIQMITQYINQLKMKLTMIHLLRLHFKEFSTVRILLTKN